MREGYKYSYKVNADRIAEPPFSVGGTKLRTGKLNGNGECLIFRYNNRTTKDNSLNDADRFSLAASQISGKRLTYAELTGKVGERRPF